MVCNLVLVVVVVVVVAYFRIPSFGILLQEPLPARIVDWRWTVQCPNPMAVSLNEGAPFWESLY